MYTEDILKVYVTFVIYFQQYATDSMIVAKLKADLEKKDEEMLQIKAKVEAMEVSFVTLKSKGTVMKILP